jgi:hypothetical protein
MSSARLRPFHAKGKQRMEEEQDLGNSKQFFDNFKRGDRFKASAFRSSIRCCRTNNGGHKGADETPQVLLGVFKEQQHTLAFEIRHLPEVQGRVCFPFGSGKIECQDILQ